MTIMKHMETHLVPVVMGVLAFDFFLLWNIEEAPRAMAIFSYLFIITSIVFLEVLNYGAIKDKIEKTE